MPVNEIAAGQPQKAAGSQGGTTEKDGGLNGGAKLAEDFDTFLNILVTQLKNQDPLEPMKSQEFTNQLVQFSGVEQAIATNDKLDKMLAAQGDNRATQAVNFIGKEVEVDGNQIELENGEASFGYTLEEPAANGAVLISNQAGQIVRSMPLETGAGQHEATWDGKTDGGGTAPDGVYTIQVRAVDENDKTVTANPQVRGTVDGFEIRDDKVFLNVGDREIPFEKVKAVHDKPAPASDPSDSSDTTSTVSS